MRLFLESVCSISEPIKYSGDRTIHDCSISTAMRLFLESVYVQCFFDEVFVMTICNKTYYTVITGDVTYLLGLYQSLCAMPY